MNPIIVEDRRKENEKSNKQRLVYFEDLKIGLQPLQPEIVVDEGEMLDYSRKYDPWPIHIDGQAAEASTFGKVIASGGFTLSLAYLLSHKIYNTPESAWAFIAGFDGHLNLPAPVFAGDTLKYTLEIVKKRLTSKPGRGIVKV
jgi:acyl dehydratase